VLETQGVVMRVGAATVIVVVVDVEVDDDDDPVCRNLFMVLAL
jgi:hypothetical protein